MTLTLRGIATWMVALPLAMQLVWCRSASATPAGEFLAETYRGRNGREVPYRLLIPANYDRRKTYPVVVWLHGSGEVGTDNQRQLSNGAEVFNSPKYRAEFPAFVIVPQCPRGERWATMSSATAPGHLRMSSRPTASAQAAFELIEDLRAQYNFDSRRTYVIGLSMGGFGAWDWIVRRPDLFSAALPMSGGGDTHEAGKLVNTRIWAFHGGRDNVVGAGHSRAMIRAIQARGGHPLYTEIPGGGHGPWNTIIEDPQVLAWLKN